MGVKFIKIMETETGIMWSDDLCSGAFRSVTDKKKPIPTLNFELKRRKEQD